MKTFGFDQLVGGNFFANARLLRSAIPKHLTLLEPHAGIGVINITVFNFTESEVGGHGELVISALLAPWATKSDNLPYASYYPIFLATTTKVSQDFVTRNFYMPKFEHEVDINFDRQGETRSVSVSHGGARIIELAVRSLGSLEPTSRSFQCFSSQGEQLYRAAVDITGQLCEHEEETGQLIIGPHEAGLQLGELFQERIPFREQFMESGVEYFHLPLAHDALRG